MDLDRMDSFWIDSRKGLWPPGYIYHSEWMEEEKSDSDYRWISPFPTIKLTVITYCDYLNSPPASLLN